MFFHLTTRIISSVSAFLYPGYASYKVLSQRPASEEELERWLMYWSVLGCIVGVEYLAEWLISWIPFYYTIKTLFLLYLALPQTRGASYIYITYLQPFFHMHEQQIDATLASFKARAYEFVQERLKALWDAAAGSIYSQQQQQPQPQQQDAAVGAVPPPRMTDPVSGPAQLVSSFWRSYGPTIVASGAAILRSATGGGGGGGGGGGPGAGNSGSTTLNTPPPSMFRAGSSNNSNTQSVLERRRELEAELAALRDVPDLHLPNPNRNPNANNEGTTRMQMPVPETLIPGHQHTGSSSRSSSSLGMRERTTSTTGRFEEIEVPSDDEGEGHAVRRPGVGSTRGSSWFGGWGGGGGGGGGGYERVKNE